MNKKNTSLDYTQRVIASPIHCVLLLFATLLLQVALFQVPSAFASANDNESNDPYYQKLIDQFPNNRKVIDSLYDSYSAWVISLSERYGMPPLLAMAASPEEEYAGLFKSPDVFIDIYKTLSGTVHSESKRASLALRLTNSFLMTDPEKNYVAAFMKAQEQDKKASSHGQPTRRYTEQFFSKGLFPENLWAEIKKTPEQYALLLNELSKADIDVLETFSIYPNSAAFLLNTGREGIKLLEQTNGEIIALSYLLTSAEQKKIPEVFKLYPGLASAISLCGPEAYFTISICPDFYFSLVEAMTGTIESRYLVAYAVFSKQIESSGDGSYLKEFLDTLSREEKQRIAFYVAGLLERLEYEGDDGAPLPIAPLFDPFFLKFVWRYGESAVEISTRFGDLLPMGKLLMEDWNGEHKDITPVLDAIRDYGELGLQAALMFRFNKKMQNIILGPVPGSRQRDALMFLFYDEAMGLSSNMSDWNKITIKLLADYRPESGTGRPVPIDGSTSFVEFVPGYDFVKMTYDAVIFGKTPTLGDLVFSALDLVQLVPIGLGTTVIVKDIAKRGVKTTVKQYTKQYVVRLGKSLVDAGTHLKDDVAKFLYDSVDALRKLSLQELRQRGRAFISAIQKASGGMYKKIEVWAVMALNRFDLSDLKKLYTHVREVAKTAGIAVKNLYDRTHHYLTGLYSRPWMLKHATDAVLNGIIVEGVLQPTLFYAGALSIIDFIEEQNAVEKMIREKLR